MSQKLDEATNRRCDEMLDARIGDIGPIVAAEGRSRDGLWKEPSRALLGVGREGALRLAREFEQRAIVWAEDGRIGIIDCPSERWTIRPIVWS